MMQTIPIYQWIFTFDDGSNFYMESSETLATVVMVVSMLKLMDSRRITKIERVIK